MKNRANGHPPDNKSVPLANRVAKAVPSLKVPPSSIKQSLQSSPFLQSGAQISPPVASSSSVRTRKLEKAMRFWKYYPDANQPRKIPNAYSNLLDLITEFNKDEKLLKRHKSANTDANAFTNVNAYRKRVVATPHRLYTPMRSTDQLTNRSRGWTGRLDVSEAEKEKWMREDVEMAKWEAAKHLGSSRPQNLQKTLETSISKQREEVNAPPPPQSHINKHMHHKQNPKKLSTTTESQIRKIAFASVANRKSMGLKCWLTPYRLCFVEEDGLNYCAKCYEALLAPSCAKCTLPITKECLKNQLPYCEKDWNQFFTTKCTQCKAPITVGDKWVEFGPNKAPFHTTCFCCKQCNISLEGQSFYTRDGLPYCKLHA
uniref:LIM zinc-binding domain-containing protein n=1 Tax=Ditylenchus dipsaci TaxID=166011 RepID=A0A915EAL0_9BILA